LPQEGGRTRATTTATTAATTGSHRDVDRRTQHH
jgi:hypothetical protein